MPVVQRQTGISASTASSFLSLDIGLFHTCSAIRPPSPSLILTKAATSPFIRASKPSIAGGRASGSCLGVTALVADGSAVPDDVDTAATDGTPFVVAFGPTAEEAISSRREVAASSLRKKN